METSGSPAQLPSGLSAVPHGLGRIWTRLAGLLVLVSLTLHYGFPLPAALLSGLKWLNVGLFAVYSADLALALARSRNRRRTIGLRRLEYFLLFVFWTILALTPVLAYTDITRSGALPMDAWQRIFFTAIELSLFSFFGAQLLRVGQRLFVSGLRPELMLAGSFALLIMAGSLLLLLPNSSSKSAKPIGVVDAVFTATSAVCVTGLTVRDTGADFSTFGQFAILALIQVGGLGIIIFVAFLSVSSTRALPISQMVLFQRVINAPAASDLGRQFMGIVLFTGCMELLGGLLLYSFAPGGLVGLERLTWSLFHSVSAFCNAGFALQPDSLIPYADNTGLVLSFSLLIVAGGLGFLAIPELLSLAPLQQVLFRISRAPLVRRLTFFPRVTKPFRPARLSVQTRLSLTVMTVLLLGGLFGFWLLEYNHSLGSESGWESLLISLFQSVTTRTAGFNTVAIDQLQVTTLLFIMILMVIGANPVSTGGGIKTVSFGILLLALRSMVTRRDRVEAFGRTIPIRTLFAALSVFVLYMILSGTGVFLLALFDPQFTLQQQIFEVVSALSTVGLSLGITPELSVPGKLVLCVAMFIGRVGPISLVLSVFQSQKELTYEFPQEEVVVG